MEITTRSLWTLIHGMGFGALHLLAGSGAVALTYRRFSADVPIAASPQRDHLLGIYLAVMAALAWLTILTGTYIIYLWYRATPPKGTTNLGAYPRICAAARVSPSPALSATHERRSFGNCSCRLLCTVTFRVLMSMTD